MAKNILICDDAAFMRMMIKDISDQRMVMRLQEKLRMDQKAVEKYHGDKAGSGI